MSSILLALRGGYLPSHGGKIRIFPVVVSRNVPKNPSVERFVPGTLREGPGSGLKRCFLKDIRNIRTKPLGNRAPIVISLVLSALLGVVLWEGAQHLTVKAEAAALLLPDPAAQRNAMLKAQKETNAKLGELLRLLKSGKLKVIVTSEKDTTGEQKKSKSKK